MDPVVFTSQDTPTLRRAVRFLRRMEQRMPGAAPRKTREGVLTAALALDEQADNQGTAAALTLRETRRPIFNQLVALGAGGLVLHDEAKAMLDAHEDAVRAAAEEGVVRFQGALLALHPKTANPRHGCCATSKLCRDHRPECRSSEHTIGGQVPWPCRTLRAAGIISDADADAQAVREALARLDRAADPDGYPGRKKANRGRAVHATRQTDDGIGDIGVCGMYFPRDMESSLDDSGTAVSCQACVKTLARKELADAELNAALAGPKGCPRNVIDGDVGGHFFKKGALSDSPIACIYCGTPKTDANSAGPLADSRSGRASHAPGPRPTPAGDAR
ncbi:hypothetical protein ACW4TU_41545 [Streptomyces sp. QTS52]